MSFYEEITNFTRNENVEYVFCDLANTPMLDVIFKLFNKISYYPRIWSLIGSILVGLSGIFPLLVIPIEEGENLKFGDGANRLGVLLGFAVGSLLGDVFLHLLPEAWNLKSDRHSHPSLFSGLWVLIGMLVCVIVEKLSSSLKTDEKPVVFLKANGVHNGEKNKKLQSPICINNNNTINNSKVDKTEEKKNYHIRGYLNLMANSLDNFNHGLAIGGSFAISFKMGVLSTFAILVHELPHEIGDFAILLKSGFSRWDAAKAQFCTAFAGIIGSMVAGGVTPRSSWILPFTAGGFLHIALVSILPGIIHEKSNPESFKQLGSLVLGIAVMGFLNTFFE